MDLMFNLTGYRSTVSGSVLSGVAAIFLPLTWICGVYGMNFAIIPELQWGVDPITGEGQPLGYMYFWVMSIVFALIAILLLRFLRVF
jgi:Mg2+ and Co2+ transporter CorA